MSRSRTQTWADLVSDDDDDSGMGLFVAPLRQEEVVLADRDTPIVAEESTCGSLPGHFMRFGGLLNLPKHTQPPVIPGHSIPAGVMVHAIDTPRDFSVVGINTPREAGSDTRLASPAANSRGSGYARTPSPHSMGIGFSAPTHSIDRVSAWNSHLPSSASHVSPFPVPPFPTSDEPSKTPARKSYRRSAYKRGTAAADDDDASGAKVAGTRRRRPHGSQSPQRRKACKVAFIERHTPLDGEQTRRTGDLEGSEEEWKRRMNRRRIQVALGKSTIGYVNYVAAVKYIERPDEHPPTPDFRTRDLSRKDFEARILVWRAHLHKYAHTERTTTAASVSSERTGVSVGGVSVGSSGTMGTTGTVNVQRTCAVQTADVGV